MTDSHPASIIPLDFISTYPSTMLRSSMLIMADCFEWMAGMPEASVHAIVTDPPYGVKEYDREQLEKRIDGSGGVWRIPPAFDGHKRAPLPRFTALNDDERTRIHQYFCDWGQQVLRILRPGGHIFLASNVFLSQLVFSALTEAGLEFRGQIIRQVQTLRGGDRPKNAEIDYPDVCTMPRGCFEPWGLFRKQLPKKMKVSDCLAEYETGGLRRRPNGTPFQDMIDSKRTPKREREIANHPSIKPQSFLRQIVYAALPLGTGVVVDPFMGSGSTIAAAEFLGYSAIGIERLPEYYEMSKEAVPRLATLYTKETQLELDL